MGIENIWLDIISLSIGDIDLNFFFFFSLKNCEIYSITIAFI